MNLVHIAPNCTAFNCKEPILKSIFPVTMNPIFDNDESYFSATTNVSPKGHKVVNRF